MGAADLETGELVERSLEDQVRQRDRRFERVADDVGEPAAALEPTARFEFRGSLRVDKNEDAERLGLGPERVELGVGQLGAVDAAADQRTAHPELLYRRLELLGGEVGM